MVAGSDDPALIDSYKRRPTRDLGLAWRLIVRCVIKSPVRYRCKGVEVHIAAQQEKFLIGTQFSA
jgi:hypothetical protein